MIYCNAHSSLHICIADFSRNTHFHSGTDGVVRTATVKTENSEFERPAVKLCVLNRAEFSPLMYWKTNCHRCPYLSSIARDIFCIPASPANIRRCFSSASIILSARRNRLDQGKVRGINAYCSKSPLDRCGQVKSFHEFLLSKTVPV